MGPDDTGCRVLRPRARAEPGRAGDVTPVWRVRVAERPDRAARGRSGRQHAFGDERGAGFGDALGAGRDEARLTRTLDVHQVVVEEEDPPAWQVEPFRDAVED